MSVQVQRPAFPVRAAEWEDLIPPASAAKNSCLFFRHGGVLVGVLAHWAVGAVDSICLQRAARNSAAASRPGSSLIDALFKMFAVRPD